MALYVCEWVGATQLGGGRLGSNAGETNRAGDDSFGALNLSAAFEMVDLCFEFCQGPLQMGRRAFAELAGVGETGV